MPGVTRAGSSSRAAGNTRYGRSFWSTAEGMSVRLEAWLAAGCAYDLGEAADFAWRGEGVLGRSGLTKIVRLISWRGVEFVYLFC
jgi:hypothetical protein